MTSTYRNDYLGLTACRWGDSILIMYDEGNSIGYPSDWFEKCPAFIRRSLGVLNAK